MKVVISWILLVIFTEVIRDINRKSATVYSICMFNRRWIFSIIIQWRIDVLAGPNSGPNSLNTVCEEVKLNKYNSITALASKIFYHLACKWSFVFKKSLYVWIDVRCEKRLQTKLNYLYGKSIRFKETRQVFARCKTAAFKFYS